MSDKYNCGPDGPFGRQLRGHAKYERGCECGYCRSARRAVDRPPSPQCQQTTGPGGHVYAERCVYCGKLKEEAS